MKTAHTPGPWEARPLTYSDGPHVPGCYAVEHKGTRQWVASQVTPRDAALVAAAPDLLAALEDVELRCTQARLASNIGKKKDRTDFLRLELQRIAEDARAAIVRAKGEG